MVTTVAFLSVAGTRNLFKISGVLQGASVQIALGASVLGTFTTDQSGQVKARLPKTSLPLVGNYTITLTKSGFGTVTQTVTVSTDPQTLAVTMSFVGLALASAAGARTLTTKTTSTLLSVKQ